MNKVSRSIPKATSLFTEYFGRTQKNLLYIFGGMMISTKMWNPEVNFVAIDYILFLILGLLFFAEFWIQLKNTIKLWRKRK